MQADAANTGNMPPYRTEKRRRESTPGLENPAGEHAIEGFTRKPRTLRDGNHHIRQFLCSPVQYSSCNGIAAAGGNSAQRRQRGNCRFIKRPSTQIFGVGINYVNQITSGPDMKT